MEKTVVGFHWLQFRVLVSTCGNTRWYVHLWSDQASTFLSLPTFVFNVPCSRAVFPMAPTAQLVKVNPPLLSSPLTSQLSLRECEADGGGGGGGGSADGGSEEETKEAAAGRDLSD